MSASSNTTTGALPPSSRCTFLSESEAAFAIHSPVSGEPVSETMSTSGCVTSDDPAGWPWPVITFSTPFGSTSPAYSASLTVEIGVVSAGFSTIVQPAARAGPIFHAAIMSGQFHGVFVEQVRELQHRGRALGRGGGRPPVEGSLRGLDRPVHVLLGGQRH